MSIVHWDEVSKSNSNSNSNGKKVDFLRFKTGTNYRIRPIYYPMKFFKYFHQKDGKLRTAICMDPDTCPVKEAHPELKKPSVRFASYVIDRADDKVKVLEGPQMVFRPLGSHMEATGKNPGGSKDGSDWQIKVSGSGLQKKYDATFLDNTPFTKDEQDMIREAIGGDVKDALSDLFKADSPEQIEKKLFGDWGDNSAENGTATDDAEPEVTDGPSAPAENSEMNW
jgi:hypothetical protein